MEEFDPKKAIETLSFFVGQALALLSVDDQGMQDALDRTIGYHEANATTPSGSVAMNAVRLGSEKIWAAKRTGQIRREPPQE